MESWKPNGPTVWRTKKERKQSSSKSQVSHFLIVKFIFSEKFLRLIWSTGVNTPTSTYVVGLYLDEKFLSKGSGETVEIAEEMAARDALRRIFGTGEETAPIPYGEKARKFSQMINSIYEKFKNSSV